MLIFMSSIPLRLMRRLSRCYYVSNKPLEWHETRRVPRHLLSGYNPSSPPSPQSLSGKQLPEYPVELYRRARQAVDKQTAGIKRRMLILTWQANVRQCEAEIREFFVMAMKRFGLLCYSFSTAKTSSIK